MGQLGPIQSEILSMLTADFLTVKQIATRRQTKIDAVYKIITKLRKKGYLGRGYNRGYKNPRPLKLIGKISKGMIRLHGQQWRINILMGTHNSEKYKRIKDEGNVLHIDGNTVELNNEDIEIYSPSDVAGNSEIGFFGADVQRATAISFEYWNKFFWRLEDELGIIIMKSRANNKKLVHTGHYAEVGNALAEDYNEKKVKLEVYGLDDGKLWFKIDNSFNLHEAESVHAQKSKPDMERVKEAFNEYRDNEGFLPSDILKLIKETNINVNEIGAGLNGLIKLNKPPELDKPKKDGLRPSYIG